MSSGWAATTRARCQSSGMGLEGMSAVWPLVRAGGTVGCGVVSAVDLLVAAAVAFVAGVINSIAGGGSLILFPTLVALGLPTVSANVTNSVSQWPGYLGGVAGFREEYAGQRRRLIRF